MRKTKAIWMLDGEILIKEDIYVYELPRKGDRIIFLTMDLVVEDMVQNFDAEHVVINLVKSQ